MKPEGDLDDERVEGGVRMGAVTVTRRTAWTIGLALGLVLGLGASERVEAASAPQTSRAVLQAIAEALRTLTQEETATLETEVPERPAAEAPPGPEADTVEAASRKVAGWRNFFQEVQAVIEAQAEAESAEERLEHLERLGRMADTLEGTGWRPAQRVANALRAWAEPRRQSAAALIRLEAAIEELSDEAEEGGESPRARWRSFVTALNDELRRYEAASTMSNRLDAARRIRGSLASLREAQARSPWPPAQELETAIDAWFDGPNLQASAGLETLRPFLSREPVKPEVIFFRGQTTYVTPGAYTGFALLESDRGLAFSNSQYSHSRTPIRDFQEQIASDRRGRRAANLYQFSATSINTNHVVAKTILTPAGLEIHPENHPSVTAEFDARPKPGCAPHFGRSLAGLAGFDRDRILNEVRENALPQLRRETAEGTRQISAMRSAEEEAKRNAELNEYFVGDRTIRIEDVALTELAMSSTPAAGFLSSVIRWPEAGSQIGAATPKPDRFDTVEPGATIDLHLNSTLTNLAAWFYERPEVKETSSVLLVFPENQSDSADPPELDLDVARNATYADLLEAIEAARVAPETERTTAIRVVKPERPPQFGVDNAGRLVMAARDVVIEVPAPENFGRSGGILGFRAAEAPKALRYEIETIVIVLQLALEPNADGSSLRIAGAIEAVLYGGQNTSVSAVGEQEDDVSALNLLNRSAALGVLAGRVRGETFETTVSLDRLPGFRLASVSDFDPSGWMRIVLTVDPSESVTELGSIGAQALAR